MKPLPVVIGVLVIGAAVSAIAWLSRPRASDAVTINEQGQASANPFEIPETGPYPKAVLSEETYDFGKMILGETRSHPFVIRNEGEAPLKLQKGFITCKCTVPTIPGGAIPPGESAEVVMEWEPLGITDSFDKYAEIWTNDPENPQLRLTITGAVRDLVQVQPPAPWTVTTISEGEPTVFSGGIASGRDEFQIVSIESTAPWIQIEPRSADAAELEEIGQGMASGYMLDVTIRPEMTVGRFNEKVTITTDLDDNHTLEIPVSGTRPGPFSIIGQAWFGREMTVRMGEVPAADGKSVTVSLFTSPEDEPLALTSVKSDPDIAEVSLTRDESFPAKAKEKYDLTFTLPPGSPVGRYADDKRIDLHLTTNRESIPEVHLSIVAIVE